MTASLTAPVFAGSWYAVYGLAQDSLIAANLGARVWKPSSSPEVARATWWTLVVAVVAVVAVGISLALEAPVVLLVPAAAATLVGAFELTVIARRDR